MTRLTSPGLARAMVVTAIVLAAASLSQAQTREAEFKPAVSLAGPAVRKPVVSVSTPVLGHFFDRISRQLQPVLGFAGSGYLGDALTAGTGAAAVSPAQDYALLFSSGEVSLLSLREAAARPLLLPGVIAGVDRIAISPSGSAAMLYAVASGRAQILKGFPDAPVIAQEFVISGLGGSIGVMAVNDAGDAALVAAVTDTTVLYALKPGAAPAAAYRAQSLSGLTFLRNSNDALLTAAAQNEAIWLRDAAGAASAVLLADARSGLSAPAAIAASEDGSRAFVLYGGGLLSLSLSGAQATSVKCACKPTLLQRLTGRDVFLLTDSLDSPLPVFDGGSDAPAISFIRVDLPRPAQMEKANQ